MTSASPALDDAASVVLRPAGGAHDGASADTRDAQRDAAATAAPDVAILDDPLELQRFSRLVLAPDGTRQAESTLQVSGITCAACSGILEAALARVDGVLEARVSAAAERAHVRWDPQRTRPSALIKAIRGAGYDAVPDAAAPARELRRREQRRMLWRLFVAWFCMMQVMMMATPAYVAAPGDLTDDLRQLLNWGGWVLTLPVMLFSAGPFFRGAWRALRQRRIGMDVPVALGLAVAFGASSGATFDPGGLFGHEVYFDSVTMFAAFLLSARYLEMRARHRAHASLEATLAAMPPTAWRETGGPAAAAGAAERSETAAAAISDAGASEPAAQAARGRAGADHELGAGGADAALERVSVQRLQPGDIVRVPLGEPFPADGVLLEGATSADEALLSGESAPVRKTAGATLVAGSTNVGAPVRMRVERVGADTRFEAIVAMMRDAVTQRPATARLADRWAAPFLWTVLLLAAGSAAAWSLVDPSRAVAVAVAVLIVTCPCALSLAAPATLVAAAGGLARRGVQVQRLDAIEQFARVDHLFVDKTGTLTDERLRVVALHRPEGAEGPADEVWRHAAGLARWSSHPVAQALAAGAPVAAAPMQAVQEQPGVGLSGTDAQGRVWRLEDASAARRRSPDAAAWIGTARSLLSCDGVPMAAFELDEGLRPGAEAALRALQADGLRVTLLSGDARERVAALAERLAVADWQGQARPEDKLAAVAAAQRAGRRTAMVGDGVNDGPVLARADVSLAMGQGALVARGQADAVVSSGDWNDILRLRDSARRAVRIVRQNFVWAGLYNAACIPLAMAGWLPPWAAGLGMALSSLLVVGNATRAARAPGTARAPRHAA